MHYVREQFVAAGSLCVEMFLLMASCRTSSTRFWLSMFFRSEVRNARDVAFPVGSRVPGFQLSLQLTIPLVFLSSLVLGKAK